MVVWLGACGAPAPSSAPALGAGWVAVPGGTARLGSSLTEACRDEDEAPREQAVAPFAMAAREVTRRQFREGLGYDPSFGPPCPTCPVDSVTHDEAEAWCNGLSEREGRPQCYRCTGAGRDVRCDDGGPACTGYRLPTEAEWEVAARAGTSTATPAGPILSCMARDETADRIAWYKANSGGHSHPVGTKEPNDLGLYDLTGNVYEWTADRDAAATGERILRGGSWYHNAEHLRSANRYRLPAHRGLSHVGFRCVRSLPVPR